MVFAVFPGKRRPPEQTLAVVMAAIAG